MKCPMCKESDSGRIVGSSRYKCLHCGHEFQGPECDCTPESFTITREEADILDANRKQEAADA